MYSRLGGMPAGDLVGRSVRAVFVEHGTGQKVLFVEIEDGRDTVKSGRRR